MTRYCVTITLDDPTDARNIEERASACELAALGYLHATMFEPGAPFADATAVAELSIDQGPAVIHGPGSDF